MLTDAPKPGANPTVATPSTPIILVRKTPPSPSPVFDTFWRFAHARQQIYHTRLRGEPSPWTWDPVLSTHRFTNCYRASDRVSQYLIGQVQRKGPQDPENQVLRTLLFKLFNRIETWELLQQDGTIDKESFEVAALDPVLTRARGAGVSIYSAAYIMPSGPAELRTTSKHRMHLEFLARSLRDGTIARLAAAGDGVQGLYLQLLALPGLGNFLAYQYAIDLNYTEHFQFSEDAFVVPGPGARDGLRKCFTSLGEYTEADTLHWMRERQALEFAARDLAFQDLWGRALSSLDLQNLACEVSKVARVAHPDVKGISGREHIKQRFSPSDRPLPAPVFPAWWGIQVPAGLGAPSAAAQSPLSW